jgi:hypothetical protein
MEVQQIPYIAYEAECARHDRNIRRLVLVIVLCVCLIVISNLAWLYVWQQYDYEEEIIEYTQDGRGINIIGNENEATQHGSATGYQEENP